MCSPHPSPQSHLGSEVCCQAHSGGHWQRVSGLAMLASPKGLLTTWQLAFSRAGDLKKRQRNTGTDQHGSHNDFKSLIQEVPCHPLHYFPLVVHRTLVHCGSGLFGDGHLEGFPFTDTTFTERKLDPLSCLFVCLFNFHFLLRDRDKV